MHIMVNIFRSVSLVDMELYVNDSVFVSKKEHIMTTTVSFRPFLLLMVQTGLSITGEIRII